MSALMTVTVRERGGASAVYTFKKNKVYVGRASRNDIVLPRRRVSDQHIVLYRKKDRFIVTDLASTHGTFVGGRKIDRPTLLAEGESVVVGDFALTSQIGAPTRTAASEVWRSDLPSSQERFERLRSMLYGERTEGAWMALCNLLDEWPEDEDLAMGLDYADAHLGAWDNALRRAPEHWKEPMIKGRADPRFKLVRRLDLSYHFLGPRGADEMARAPWLPGLRILALRTCYLGSHGVEALMALRGLSGLMSLDLSHNTIGDEGALALARNPRLDGLETLILDANMLGEEGVMHIVTSPILSGVVDLALAQSNGGPEIAAVLARSKMAQLSTLNLDGCGFGPEGLAKLVEAPCLGALTSLGLGHNRMGDTGARALARMPESRLRSLDLSHNLIGDAGARALASAPALSGLRRLDMTGNRVTQRGISALASSPHLSRLTVLEV